MEEQRIDLLVMELGVIRLGKAGEGNRKKKRFMTAAWRQAHPDAQISLHVTPPNGVPYLAALDEDEDGNVIWTITDADTAWPGSGKIELILSDPTTDTTIKSVTGRTVVDESPSQQEPGEPPEPHRPWWEKVLQLIAMGAGTGGTGVSPTIKVEDITGGHRLTITDILGTKTVDVMDGEDGAPGAQGAAGENGVSPTVKIETITGGHRVTITDKDGAKSFDVMDGQDGSGGGSGAAIDDETPSATTTYSSSHIDELLNEQKEANATQDERLTELEQNTPSGTSGLTTAQVNALDGMFKIAAYTTDAADAYAAFKTAFGIEDAPAPDEPDVPVVNKYTITNMLENVTTSNPVTSVSENSSYMSTLTPDDGYTLEGGTVSVTMGGEDITATAYADGVITIAAVTGAVVITAAAVAVESGDDGELVYLKNISFDGKSYLDTGFIPSDVNERYVLGVQSPGTEINDTKIWIAGVSMRNNTNITTSDYFDILFKYKNNSNNYNADRPVSWLTISYAGKESGISAGSDKGDGLSSQFYDGAMYASFTNGSQSLWMDEELTIAPTTGHFQKINVTDDLTSGSAYDVAKFPIQSMWIGRPRVTSSVMQGTYGDGKIRDGMKFYCFKVYDADDNLIVNLRPAKQGSAIGMYDEIAQKFIAAEANGGTVSYEEVTA